jgi:hypothetical protein
MSADSTRRVPVIQDFGDRIRELVQGERLGHKPMSPQVSRPPRNIREMTADEDYF